MNNPTVKKTSPLELLHKKIGMSKKDFKSMEQRIPCYQCIVLAACKGRGVIDCDILLKYYQMCLAYGANTIIVTQEMHDLFPNAVSFNGTVLL